MQLLFDFLFLIVIDIKVPAYKPNADFCIWMSNNKYPENNVTCLLYATVQNS